MKFDIADDLHFYRYEIPSLINTFNIPETIYNDLNKIHYSYCEFMDNINKIEDEDERDAKIDEYYEDEDSSHCYYDFVDENGNYLLNNPCVCGIEHDFNENGFAVIQLTEELFNDFCMPLCYKAVINTKGEYLGLFVEGNCFNHHIAKDLAKSYNIPYYGEVVHETDKYLVIDYINKYGTLIYLNKETFEIDFRHKHYDDPVFYRYEGIDFIVSRTGSKKYCTVAKYGLTLYSKQDFSEGYNDEIKSKLKEFVYLYKNELIYTIYETNGVQEVVNIKDIYRDNPSIRHKLLKFIIDNTNHNPETFFNE